MKKVKYTFKYVFFMFIFYLVLAAGNMIIVVILCENLVAAISHQCFNVIIPSGMNEIQVCPMGECFSSLWLYRYSQ
jgi:hypothetical protein